MKKFNKNILVFAFFIVFIIIGIWGDCFEQLKWKTIDLAVGIKHGNISSFFDYKYYVDDISNKELSYHDTMMDVNSVKENLLGTRVIFKDDATVVKMDSGSLSSQSKKIDTKEIKKTVEAINRLKSVSEKNGAKFLYCAAPTKPQYEKSPENIDNFAEDNYQSFLKQMNAAQIPYIDFKQELDNSNIESDSIYYFTDHHWKVNSGFFATRALCKELNSRYGFSYDEKYTDLSNYNIQSYSNLFLGSFGKKVGTYFTWDGADDFDLITPKFDTNLTEEQPFKNEKRSGKFEDTVLFMDNMKKDYYGMNTYATYSGGDFRLQIMKNNLIPNGKKILLIRDSFACVVAPFLALQTSELHICDMRNYEYYVGEKLNAEEYIKQIKPDYVIVLYSGVSSIEKSDGIYDFF